MGNNSSKPRRRSKSRKSRKGEKSEKKVQKELKVQEEVVEIPLTDVEKIHKNYGQQGIKTILAKYDSKYQSLTYIKITERCSQLVNQIEEKGQKTIDDYKTKSEEDFDSIIKGIQEKNQGSIKKTEARSRKTIRQLLQFDQQLCKYEDSRTIMKEKFQDEKFQLRKTIKEQTRAFENIDVTQPIPEFDERPEETKLKMIEEAQEKYGKKWFENQEETKKNSRQGHFQFDFTKNHRPKFQKLIPEEDCEEKRKEIKQYFEAVAKDCVETNTICC